MNNISGCQQQGVNFNGTVEKASRKLAKKMGGEVLNNLETLANGTGKNTVIRLEEMGAEYNIHAFNSRTGYGITRTIGPKSNIEQGVKAINPRELDEGIINKSISSIQNHASAGPANSTEKKEIQQEVNEVLRSQEELGIKDTSWNDIETRIAEANEREARRQSEFDRNYHNWKMQLLDNRISF